MSISGTFNNINIGTVAGSNANYGYVQSDKSGNMEVKSGIFAAIAKFRSYFNSEVQSANIQTKKDFMANLADAYKGQDTERFKHMLDMESGRPLKLSTAHLIISELQKERHQIEDGKTSVPVDRGAIAKFMEPEPFENLDVRGSTVISDEQIADLMNDLKVTEFKAPEQQPEVRSRSSSMISNEQIDDLLEEMDQDVYTGDDDVKTKPSHSRPEEWVSLDSGNPLAIYNGSKELDIDDLVEFEAPPTKDEKPSVKEGGKEAGLEANKPSGKGLSNRDWDILEKVGLGANRPQTIEHQHDSLSDLQTIEHRHDSYSKPETIEHQHDSLSSNPFEELEKVPETNFFEDIPEKTAKPKLSNQHFIDIAAKAHKASLENK